jgi:hypothetical protein
MRPICPVPPGWTRERDFSCFFMALGLEYCRPALNCFGQRSTPQIDTGRFPIPLFSCPRTDEQFRFAQEPVQNRLGRVLGRSGYLPLTNGVLWAWRANLQLARAAVFPEFLLRRGLPGGIRSVETGPSPAEVGQTFVSAPLSHGRGPTEA